MKLEDFKPGDGVLYIPNHANGDRKHRDCESGTVNSVNEKYVFVRFDKTVAKLGYSETTSQACNPENLVKI